VMGGQRKKREGGGQEKELWEEQGENYKGY
jgi:hypothetical protein